MSWNSYTSIALLQLVYRSREDSLEHRLVKSKLTQGLVTQTLLGKGIGI